MRVPHFFLLTFSFLLLLPVLPGCRRTDVREMTVSLPALQEADKAKVVEALARYNGVEKDSYRWDMTAKTLTLRYDSMQIAKKNIEMAIAGAGFTANGVTPESIGATPKRK